MQAIQSALRALYDRYGYRQYRMSKFEEYDLYARNKDFLISDHVITFTDLSGKLMALKPDVTLSIVKNSSPNSGVQKVYYNENVYRVTKGSHGFREIMQMGLECLGAVDDYSISEVLMLAAESLSTISSDAVLDVSHLGILKELTDSLDFPIEYREKLVYFISQKNPHELTALCEQCGIDPEQTELLCWLASTSGAPAVVLPQMKQKLSGFVSDETMDRFEAILSALDSATPLRIDFSVVDDIHYYNGVVFKGFVQGLPGSVLSGGQYDKLMKKMNRSDRAIGFAVYLDMLERLEQPADEYDVDAVLLYDDSTPLCVIGRQVKEMTEKGLRVMASRTAPEGIRFRQLFKIIDGEVETCG